MQEPITTSNHLDWFYEALETIKDKTRIEWVAKDSGGDFKLLGNGRLLGHCLSKDHTDKTPSMTIFTDTQRFKCFGCGVHGDVVDLEMLAGDYDSLRWALVGLSVRYNVPLDERSPEWMAWQNHKQRRRELARDALTASYQRRYFRLYGTHLKAIEAEDERREEAQKFWEGMYPLAYLSATWRLGL